MTEKKKPTEKKPPAAGKLLVQKGVITPEHLREGLVRQKSSRLPLGYVLLKLGYCSFDDVQQAAEEINASLKMAKKTSGKKLGETLVEKRVITQEQLSKALEYQKSTRLPLGMVFEQLGYLSEYHLFSHLVPAPEPQKKTKKNGKKKEK